MQSSLLLFILPVALGNGAVLVGAGKGIEYPDVEVCPLPVSSPKVLCDDVKAGQSPCERGVCCVGLSGC